MPWWSGSTFAILAGDFSDPPRTAHAGGLPGALTRLIRRAIQDPTHSLHQLFRQERLLQQVRSRDHTPCSLIKSWRGPDMNTTFISGAGCGVLRPTSRPFITGIMTSVTSRSTSPICPPNLLWRQHRWWPPDAIPGSGEYFEHHPPDSVLVFHQQDGLTAIGSAPRRRLPRLSRDRSSRGR